MLSSDPDILSMLRDALNDPREMVVAEAIDGLRRGRFGSELEWFLSLRLHPSPYVQGAVLRFVSAFELIRAIPLGWIAYNLLGLR